MNPNQIIPAALTIIERGAADFVRGGSVGVAPESRVPSGDWTAWLPNYEPQKFKFDTNECSQLSGVNCVETNCNYLKVTGKFSAEAIKWFSDNGYLDDATGLFDISERFTAIMSGTSINGNSQWSFWVAAAKYGLLPWKDLHYSMEESQAFNTQQDMCADYYNPDVITPAMRVKALLSLKYLQIQYQWIHSDYDTTTPDNLITDALLQAPLQIGTPACLATWNTGAVLPCGMTAIQHATMLYKMSADGTKSIRDHYQPMNKILAPDYFIPIIIQGIVSPVPVVDKNWKHTFAEDLQYGDQGDEVKNLQRALSILGYIPARYITGNFLDKTAAALLQFQLDKKLQWSWVLNWYQGHYFSTRSRVALSTIFSS